MLRGCKRATVYACLTMLALAAPAAARKPLHVPVSTAGGVDLRGFSVAFHYPRGVLSSDFIPPSWVEPARAGGCQAQLVLTAPTMGPAIVPPELVLADRFGKVVYRRPSAPPAQLALEWMFARGGFHGIPILEYSVAIEAPRGFSGYGSVIGIGIYGQVARTGTYDEQCVNAAAERAAVRRAKAAARKLIHGFDVSSAH
jgi:hypothetical protein